MLQQESPADAVLIHGPLVPLCDTLAVEQVVAYVARHCADMLDAGIAQVVGCRTVAGFRTVADAVGARTVGDLLGGRTVGECRVVGDAVGSEDQEDPLGLVPHNLALAWDQVDIEDL